MMYSVKKTDSIIGEKTMAIETLESMLLAADAQSKEILSLHIKGFSIAEIVVATQLSKEVVKTAIKNFVTK